MSAEGITDAAVRHFVANVPGIKGAYASGAGGQGTTVRTIPSDIFDTPVAVLELTTLRWNIDPGSWEKTHWYFDVNVWFSATDAGAMAKQAVPFMSLIKDSLRSNADLYGTCFQAIAVAGGPMSAEEVNGKPYMVLPVHFYALEQGATAYTRQ